MTLSAGNVIARTMTDDQAAKLQAVHLDLFFHLSDREALETIAARIAGVLSERAIVYVLRRREWSVRSLSPDPSPVPSIGQLAPVLSQVTSLRGPAVIECTVRTGRRTTSGTPGTSASARCTRSRRSPSAPD